MRKKNKQLPPYEYLTELFDYDPNTGGIWRKGDEQIELFCKVSVTRTGYGLIWIPKYGQFLAHRIAWKMFYKEDPGNCYIDHKNCDGADNRITNLRKVKPSSTTQAKNLRRLSRYEVDEDGVGRNVSCVSDEEYERNG